MSDQSTQKHVATRIGFVESDSRDKSRTVVVGYLSRHPKYGKYVRKRTVLQVHDEKNESRKGDRVEVAPCVRKSKTKSWELVRVVEAAPDPLAPAELSPEIVNEDNVANAAG